MPHIKSSEAHHNLLSNPKTVLQKDQNLITTPTGIRTGRNSCGANPSVTLPDRLRKLNLINGT